MKKSQTEELLKKVEKQGSWFDNFVPVELEKKKSWFQKYLPG